MNTTGGPLSFEASIQYADFARQAAEVERRIVGIGNRAVSESERMDNTFKRLGQMAAGYFAFNQLSQLPAQILKVRGEFQQLEIAFTTMLRSKEKQERLMSELVQTAATTPFGLKDLAGGAKQLLAYGSTATGVIGEIRMLGDVASGVSVPINELIYLYGTLKTQGRAYAVDIRQFAGRGIPIYAELAKVLGVNVDKVADFVSAGKVGFKEVEQAFKNMTTGGGMFAGLMDAQSKSLLGLKERLSDAYDKMLNDIGKSNQDIIGGTITTVTQVVEHYQDVVDILKVAVVAYGSYKAAILLASVAQRGGIAITAAQAIAQAQAASTTGILTVSQTRAAASTALLSRAQATLNQVMSINPYVAVATVIAALVSAYFVFREEVQEVKTAQELLSESGKEVSTQIRQQGGEVKTLIGVLQNQNIAESERLKAYERLKTISPDIVAGLDFQKAKTADLTKAVQDYLVALKQKIQLEAAQTGYKESLDQQTEAIKRRKAAEADLLNAQKKPVGGQSLGMGQFVPTRSAAVAAAQARLDAAVDLELKADQAVANVEVAIDRIYTGKGSREAIQANIAKTELLMGSLDKLSPSYKKAEEDIAGYRKELDALNKTKQTEIVVSGRNVEQINDEIKAKKELLSTANTDAQNAKIRADIAGLEKQKRRLTGEKTGAEKKAEKDADKVGPFGSLSYWENVAKKADEILSKTPPSNKAVFDKQSAIKLGAEEKAEAIRKTLVKQSFSDELEEKKKAYELYQRWVSSYDQATANTQFAALITSGQSYVDYLNAQISTLEAKRDSGGLNEKDATNLGQLLTERDEATGKKTGIEVFQEGLESAQREAVSLTGYLETLRQKQAELGRATNGSSNSPDGIEKRRILAEEILQTERSRKEQLQQFVQSVEGSEAQRLEITRRYSDLRAEIDKQDQGRQLAGTKERLAMVDRAEKLELESIARTKAEATDAFKKLNDVIDAEGRKALKIRLDRLQAYLVEVEKTAGRESLLYRQIAREIKETNFAINRDTLDSFSEFAALAGELGDALGEAEGIIGGYGRYLSGVASQMKLVTVAFDETATEAERVQAGVQGVIGLVNILTQSAAQRKQAEVAYYQAITEQQRAYNLALNDQIGLQTELNENVFVKDYEGRIRDGISKLNEANKGYQESLDKLGQGRAKTGQRDAVDWKAVGQGASSGAAAGAAIGSIVPVIGTAIGAGIGAVVGGLVGLFGGKKKKDEFGALLSEYPELIRKSKDGVEELNVELARTLIEQNLVDESTKALLTDTVAWTEQIKEAKEQIKGVVSELAGSLGSSLRDALVGAFREGEDAAAAFGDSVEKVLEDILSQLIFNQVFSAQFDQLQKEMVASADTMAGGDGSWTDDFGRFFGKAEELTKLFNDGLTAAQAAASGYGLDIFAKTKDAPGSKEKPNSLSGAIKGVTEETASILAGQINAIRISQAEGLQINRGQLLAMTEIAANTRYNRYLESIDAGIKTLVNSDVLRSKGLK